MKLYLVIDEYENKIDSLDPIECTEVIGVFDSRKEALNAIRTLYLEGVMNKDYAVEGYKESESGAEWVRRSDVFVSTNTHHCLEIKEVRLNEVITSSLLIFV